MGGSQAICRFMAKSKPGLGLHGDTFHEQGEVDSWLEWFQNELEVAVSCLLQEMQRPERERRSEVKTEAHRDLVAALAVLDRHLLANSYIVGHHPTLADLCAHAALRQVAHGLVDTVSYRNLTRWFATD